MSYDPAAPDDQPGNPPTNDIDRAPSSAPGETPQPLAPEPTTPADLSREGAVSPDAVAPGPGWTAPAPERSPYRYFDAPDAGYGEVPASLELGYSSTDLGLSPNAYDRAIPYTDVARRRPNAGRRARRVGRELVETVVLALLIFFAVKAVVQNFRVEGSSMEPSLQTEQYLLVNKAIYFRVDMDKVHEFLPFISGDDGQKRHLFRTPRRGDVIVFKYPGDTSRDFIKRVIGVPGDTVEVHDETVFVNGSPLKEDYIKDPPNYTYAPKTVPPNSYWVLGDNRRNSFDSHAWAQNCQPTQQCDFVPEENIIGQAWVTYWPLDKLDFVNNKIIKPSAP